MSPQGDGESDNPITRIIQCGFGALDDSKQQFYDAVATLFASKWTWLILKRTVSS
jgi:superoxide dismutase